MITLCPRCGPIMDGWFHTALARALIGYDVIVFAVEGQHRYRTNRVAILPKIVRTRYRRDGGDHACQIAAYPIGHAAPIGHAGRINAARVDRVLCLQMLNQIAHELPIGIPARARPVGPLTIEG